MNTDDLTAAVAGHLANNGGMPVAFFDAFGLRVLIAGYRRRPLLIGVEPDFNVIPENGFFDAALSMNAALFVVRDFPHFLEWFEALGAEAPRQGTEPEEGRVG